jgi:hypothetical protein
MKSNNKPYFNNNFNNNYSNKYNGNSNGNPTRNSNGNSNGNPNGNSNFHYKNKHNENFNTPESNLKNYLLDYLYNKIDLLSSKLKENDKVFFKSIGVNSEIISSIEIEPIIDVYSFINDSKPVVNVQNTQNFELVKLLSESGDINKVIKDKTTSKNYPNHLIHILTTDQIKNEEIVKPILNFLNTDEYLNQLLKISRENINIKIKKNEQIIAQTDSLLHAITKNLSNNQKSFNLVYSNEDNHFNAPCEG